MHGAPSPSQSTMSDSLLLAVSFDDNDRLSKPHFFCEAFRLLGDTGKGRGSKIYLRNVSQFLSLANKKMRNTNVRIYRELT